MAQIRTISDIEMLEATPLADRKLPANIHEFFTRSAQNFGDKAALRFFLQGTAYQQAVTYSYRDLLAKITQTANMLHGLGIGPQDTVSYVLPNLPQTYFTLYGGEIAGIANPINPLLEPAVIAEIMNAAQTKVRSRSAPFPRLICGRRWRRLWTRCRAYRSSYGSISVAICLGLKSCWSS